MTNAKPKPYADTVWLPAIESGGQTFVERIEANVHQLAEPDYNIKGVLALPEVR